MNDLQICDGLDLPVATTSAHAEHDLVCLSHLRWDFVYQRPQHLLSRCARDRRVFFVEEPIYHDGPARLEVCPRDGGVWVAIPRLPHDLSIEQAEQAQRELLDELLQSHAIRSYVLWVYSPMALDYADRLRPIATVYDCMDELANFLGAPPGLRERERELFRRADLVFTGGHSLYEAKRAQHRAVYAFPSSIDAAHFERARRPQADPPDQADIPRPRLGFFGVIDERLDIALLDGAAALRPDWQFVMLGPVVKIDPESLPRRPNIHWLGQKSYKELPAYIAGWDLAIMPFARNDATRYISPTKTPEYLAAGRPVVSTSIRDVVRPYGERGLVAIADTPEAFVAAAEAELNRPDRRQWQQRVDDFLAGDSWDATWARMHDLIAAAIRANAEME
jgi:glycosyltransferase involved in cell wall biosynthesis